MRKLSEQENGDLGLAVVWLLVLPFWLVVQGFEKVKELLDRGMGGPVTPGQSVSERAGWAMDCCAECGKPESNGTDSHPPLCAQCADVWYGPRDEDEVADA